MEHTLEPQRSFALKQSGRGEPQTAASSGGDSAVLSPPPPSRVGPLEAKLSPRELNQPERFQIIFSLPLTYIFIGLGGESEGGA